MSTKTKIEWADVTWNPIQAKIKGKKGNGYHCTKVSLGCDNCYAERINTLRGNLLPFDGRATEFELVEKILHNPLEWKKSRRVFVQSMGDLFHEFVPFKLIDEVFKVMAKCPQYTFMLLTKRPEMMMGYVKWVCGLAHQDISEISPPENIWWGVTAENQEQADRRIPLLLQIPAKVRFVSVEPMLGPVDLKLAGPCDKKCNEYDHAQCVGSVGNCVMRNELDWVICGGETGPNARLLHTSWVQNLRDQCINAHVPFFFKSWGELRKRRSMEDPGRLLDGREWNQYPDDIPY